MRAPGELPHDLEVRGGEGGLPRVPGGHRRLEGVLCSGPVIQVVDEHQAQVNRGFRRELGMPGGDCLTERRDRRAAVPVPLVQGSEIEPGARRVIGVSGGDHGPVGLLGAGPVAPAGPQDPEGQPGTSRPLRMARVDRLAQDRLGPIRVAAIPQHLAQHARGPR
jgi:hypothetical protein